jgi:hypothetical protein
MGPLPKFYAAKPAYIRLSGFGDAPATGLIGLRHYMAVHPHPTPVLWVTYSHI